METQSPAMVAKHARLTFLLAFLALAGCATSPYVSPPQPESTAPAPTTSTTASGSGTVTVASAALLQESRSYQAAQQYDAAAASLERALRIDPRNPELWLELGGLQFALGDANQAENMARKALSLSGASDPVRPRAWTLLAKALRAQGRDSEARDAESRSRSPQ